MQELLRYAMLPKSDNMVKMGNKLLRDARQNIEDRLPAGWQTELHLAPKGHSTMDAFLKLQSPDGREARLIVLAKQALEPRAVLDLRTRLDEAGEDERLVVVAPYLSPAVRQRLADLGMGFLDLTGNARIEVSNPGLFIDASGADVNPDKTVRSRSLRGAKAGRIVRMLLDNKEPRGVRELADTAGVNPGYVSRVVALLDRQALIERKGRGRIVSVDWRRLLERWAQDAPLSSRGTQTMCLAPRGIASTTTQLRELSSKYAVTGTLAVSGLAPVAPARLAVVYVDDADEAARALDVRMAERAANVMLIEPEDDGVYEGSHLREGLRVVAVSQAAADLLTSPGRGPAEAEALIDWMKANEDAWRG